MAGSANDDEDKGKAGREGGEVAGDDLEESAAA